jgi:putative chitinase
MAHCGAGSAIVRLMCIANAVGRGAKNAREDVRTVQLLLNLNSPQVVGPIVVDGACGSGTIAAIEMFQSGVIGDKDPAGVVTVGGTTLMALRAGMGIALTEEKMRGICIHAAASLVSEYFASLLAGMQSVQINTPLRQSHFLAQLAHESGEFRYTEELASGQRYEGRKDLGNTQPGDGVRFKGRGLIQITGRANYTAFGQSIGQNFTVGNAMQRLATDVTLAVQVAVWFWDKHGLNLLADTDDVVTITKRINGGLNGIDDRRAKLERAKFFLLPPQSATAPGATLRAMEALSESAH